MSYSVMNEYLKYVLIHETHTKPTTAQPFITVNAQPGCEVDQWVKQLAKQLAKHHSTPWEVVDKEILKKAAEELKIKEKEIKDSLEKKEGNLFSDFIESFSKDYYSPSTAKMTQTIQRVIKEHAEIGNTILVGRASDMITADYKQGLHIFLEAPLEWRLNNIRQKHSLNEEEALDWIEQQQTRKHHFREQFESLVDHELAFSLTINQAHIKPEDAVELVIRTLP